MDRLAPGDDNLRVVDFVDESYGCIPGNTAMATTDGGATWTQQNPGIGGTAVDVFFVDRQEGWIVTNVKPWSGRGAAAPAGSGAEHVR
jgi:photosystem II stability/assembly factor-like uncharacterized protein